MGSNKPAISPDAWISPIILNLQSWFRAQTLTQDTGRIPAQPAQRHSGRRSVQDNRPWITAPRFSIALATSPGLPARARGSDIDSLLIRGEREELQMVWIISRSPHWWPASDTWKRICGKAQVTGRARVSASILEGQILELIWAAFLWIMWRKNWQKWHLHLKRTD